MMGLLALAAFAILAPPIMQGLVLKRIVPKLSVWVLVLLHPAVGHRVVRADARPARSWARL